MSATPPMPSPTRTCWRLRAAGAPELHLPRQAAAEPEGADVICVHGAWGGRSADADAATRLGEPGAAVKRDIFTPRATPPMHLEAGRHPLHAEVSRFLQAQCSLLQPPQGQP